MPTPSVFISYSHKDEEWKDRVVTHLRVLQMQDMLDVWDDRRIEAGDEWRAEIENALNAASVAVLLISANFLTSKFILDEEVPRLLERRAKQGVRVIPLIVKPCAWTQVKWLSPILARPKDGRALSAGNENQIDADLAALANEIAAIIKRADKTFEVSETSQVWKIAPDKVSLAKLPSTSPDLFGRENELAALDAAWSGRETRFSRREENGFLKTNVLTLVAWGGVGKSALVNKWLSQIAAENYRGAERVYGWSFYSQGAAEGRQVSADQFIAAALQWFGDPDPTLGSPWDKGERLAELIKQARTLLILDGLEPLQNPPPVEIGKIKDPALTALLRELARQNPGLVVITTRLTVDDLKDFVATQSPSNSGIASSQKTLLAMTQGTALQIDLENLSAKAGADYLGHLGVDGTDAERQDAAKDFGGHALALTLLGSYLKVVHQGDIRKRKEIPHVLDEQKQGAHARRVMASYEKFLRGKPELDIVRLMGLFDRPAERGAIDALRKPPAIQSLTSNLQSLSSAQWLYAINNLRELRLLAHPERESKDDTLDCHPLLREHFAEQLRASNPNAWREANSRLYEYYKSAAKELPDTIEEMAPLYAAVMHGCQAGKHQVALEEVFWQRIRRGESGFSWRKLGTFSAELALLSECFYQPWRKLVDGLSGDARRFVLTSTGFSLRALGRLEEALEPMKTGLEANVAAKDWKNAAFQATNISELLMTLGNLKQSLDYARQGIDLADHSRDEFARSALRTTLADALHQAGLFSEADAIFRQAEDLQKARQTKYPLLFSLQGIRYCTFLLEQGKYREVHNKVKKMMRWRVPTDPILDISLEHLTLGRAYMLRAQREKKNFSKAMVYLNRAVDGLRQAGNQEFVIRGLLGRAELHRVTGALDKAQKDLDEAFAIATRGGMRLHEADCHLEYARLALARGGDVPAGRDVPPERLYPPERRDDDAREHLSIAKKMIDEMGYHRRDEEVRELETKIS